MSTSPRILRGEERDRFVAAYSVRNETPPRYKTRHRDYLMARLMLESGLRAAEVVSIRPDHLYLDVCRLVVRDGKGEKDRDLGLGQDLCAALADWLDRREAEYPDSEWLFPTSSRDSDKPVATSHLRERVKRAARDAGLQEADRVHPHVLRHSFAVDMRESGRSLEQIQKALGHEHLTTTEQYLRSLDVSHVEAMQEVANGEDPEDDGPDVEELVSALADAAGLDADARECLTRLAQG